jgi:Subtilase family
MKRLFACLFASAAVAGLAASPAAAQPVASARKPINSAAEIPQPTVELKAKPSEIVLNQPEQVEAYRKMVAAYADDLLTNYDIRDRAARRGILSLAASMALAGHEWDKALALSAQAAALEEKPSAKATAGIMTRAYAGAAKEHPVGTDAFAQDFQARFAKEVNALDWATTSDALKATRSQFQLMSKSLLLGSLNTIDVAAANSGNKVGMGDLATFVGLRRTLTEVLPLQARILAVLDARVGKETATRADLWTRRLVTLSPAEVKKPVVVAVWDGGVDTTQFPAQLWTNSAERPNGVDDDHNGFVDDVHGIAFDPDWKPTTGLLRPMPAELSANLPARLAEVKGAMDMQAAIDSKEAAAFRARIAALKPEQMPNYQLELAALGLYLHGTTTAWTSLVGNPGGRLLVDRFDAHIDLKPHPFDEEKAQAFAAYARKSVDYFKAHGVRVVNMSWRITEPMINASLFPVDHDEAHRKARAAAVFAVMSKAMETAIRSGPNILFVAGAGNEDENIGFSKSLPAGLDLPNVITVGAVDSALKPAGFTSYGSSIDVYANGFEIPAKVPGGMPINISGTSLSAPQVTNLAAKLLAVRPNLTVAQLRHAIEGTATLEGDKKLKVINPKAALASVR